MQKISNKFNSIYFKKNNLKYMRKEIQNTKGFTLVETLMSILILTLSIMAPLSLAMQTVKYSRIATQKMEATYLAEEAIEMIYNIKKSAEIYCAMNMTDTLCYENYFSDYFLDQSSLPNQVLDSKCFGKISSAINAPKKYCNFDHNNIIYNSTKTQLKNVNDNLSEMKTYLQKNTSGLASITSSKTTYQRAINISVIDNNKDSYGVGKAHSALVTSIVCIQESGVCDENSSNKVILTNLVSR